MKSVFIDSNIPMYWAGRDSEYKEPCRAVLEAAARGKIDCCTSSEVLQEILYRFWALRDIATGHAIFDGFLVVVSQVLPVGEEDVRMARKLQEKYELGPRDLIHAAVMLNNEVTTIVTADRDFDKIKGIERLDPLDFSDRKPPV